MSAFLRSLRNTWARRWDRFVYGCDERCRPMCEHRAAMKALARIGGAR